MKSKIALAFEKCKKEKRPALITYTVAGDNTKDNSLKILNSISNHADIVELGFPHNTPIACLLYTYPSPRDQRGAPMPS